MDHVAEMEETKLESEEGSDLADAMPERARPKWGVEGSGLGVDGDIYWNDRQMKKDWEDKGGLGVGLPKINLPNILSAATSYKGTLYLFSQANSLPSTFIKEK